MTSTLGVDVSHWQGDLSSWWYSAKSNGVQFGFAKATDGFTFIDSEFARNMAGMRNAGVLRGAYHFIEVGSGAAQADHFVQTVKASNGGRLEGVLCCLDVERGEVGEITEIRNFVNRFRQSTAQPIWIYAASHWRDHIGNPPGKDLGPLWHPRYPGYTGSAATMYATAVRNMATYLAQPIGDWPYVSMWQFTDKLPIGGITSDANVYPGTLAQLQTYTVASGAVIPPAGDDMSQADVDAVNAHTDAVMSNIFSSLSHGMRPDGKTRNGTGIDQLAAAFTALTSVVTAEGTSPAELKAALVGLVNVDQIAAAIAAKLPPSSGVDLEAVKQAAKDGINQALIQGTGGTP